MLEDIANISSFSSEDLVYWEQDISTPCQSCLQEKQNNFAHLGFEHLTAVKPNFTKMAEVTQVEQLGQDQGEGISIF
jgi:hypothetical protein